ncbi:MAG TPA: protein kinase [Polyangiaceae bacterium]|nr:protein kinase [Polyangiaceae bacterium]
MEGRILAGRYRLTAKLGQGGMGSVWQAEHLALRTNVAIKLIDPTAAESPDALARFQREALSAAELRSAHIVHIMDYGIDEGVPFIAMELLEGESLAARLDRVTRLSWDETRHILQQVCRALAVAHGKGVVHRDLKPDNIFITLEGSEEVAKVLDFGVAKRLDSLSLSGDLKTRSGSLLGTPYYMSPEQALGDAGIDQRADIWSLGIIAYECLTGRRPYNKDTLGALLMSICQDVPPLPSHVALVPAGFDEWFKRTNARNPADRFPTAVEAATALNSLGSAASLPLAGPAEPPVVPAVTSGRSDRRAPGVESIVPSAVTAATSGAGVTRRRVAVALALPLLAVFSALVYWGAYRSTATPVAASATVLQAARPIPITSPTVSEPTITVVPTTAPIPSESLTQTEKPLGHPEQPTAPIPSESLTRTEKQPGHPAQPTALDGKPNQEDNRNATTSPAKPIVPTSGKRRAARINHAGF